LNAIISKFQFRSEFNLRKNTGCNSRTFLAQTFRIKTNEPFTIVKFERRSLRLLRGNIHRAREFVYYGWNSNSLLCHARRVKSEYAPWQSAAGL